MPQPTMPTLVRAELAALSDAVATVAFLVRSNDFRILHRFGAGLVRNFLTHYPNALPASTPLTAAF